ncbi:hypothetical protein MMC19_002238 [Ptychographa xylographoides]|nr:hypothetical protein [Ptychographa xylographoides]
MLLKATHFPYVAAIMLYEYAAQYVSHADDSWHSTSQGQTQRQKQFASKINSSRQARRAALPTRSDVSLGKSPIAGTGAYSKAAGADDLADMKQMMVKLGAQIDSLHLRLEHARRPSQTEGV